MYEMLAGKRPFSGKNTLALFQAIINDKQEDLPTVGDGINAFLCRALEKERKDRFTDAKDMLEVFEAIGKDPYTVPEQLLHPQKPSRLDTDPHKQPRILAFFVQKHTKKAEIRRRLRGMAQDAVDKEELTKSLHQFVEEQIEALDVHNEAQILMMWAAHPRASFVICVHPHPSYQNFSRILLPAVADNVRILHLAGHADSPGGFFWLKKTRTGTEYENRPIEDFAGLIKLVAFLNGGTVECVVLNGCSTEDLGKILKQFVPFVVCWRFEVRDETATNFSEVFYLALDRQKPQQQVEYSYDYRRAFNDAASRMSSWNEGSSHRRPAKHLADGALDFICLLSPEGDEFPSQLSVFHSPSAKIEPDSTMTTDVGPLNLEEAGVDDTGMAMTDVRLEVDMQEEDAMDDEIRNWRPPGTLPNGRKIARERDYSALAGESERKCMEHLGFSMILENEPIKIGNGIERNGFLTDQVLNLWDVKSYTCGVWGSKKQAYREAEKLTALPGGLQKIEDAVKELHLVERYRAEAMERHGGGDEKHKHQLQEIATPVRL